MTSGQPPISELNPDESGILSIDPPLPAGFDAGDWRERLDAIVETMREMSRQSDPQRMVRTYAARMERLFPSRRRISLSRRSLSDNRFRVTRFSGWKEDINPWERPDKLPELEGGLLAELIYGDEPCIINDLQVAEDDPAAEYLAGQRSLMAIPLYDEGTALNMVVVTREEPDGFQYEELPQTVWMSNLFGRATHNLVLAEQLESAWQQVDRELSVVAEIQRSLLPAKFPEISTLRLAAYYQTSRYAGGDYYDFFPLPDDKWGLLIADVSGHGTPAAVMMAITHSIAHMYPGPPGPPNEMLEFLNQKLCERYIGENGTFVTAFYGIYDARTRELSYSSAGHNPPRLRRCSTAAVTALDGTRGFPLGVVPGTDYEEATIQLGPGDRIVFYTDGITEAGSPWGDYFGVQRLDAAINECSGVPQNLLDRVLSSLSAFTADGPSEDDRTLLVADIV